MVFLWNIDWMKNDFFYSSKHMKPQGYCRPLLLYQKKSTSHTPSHTVMKKEKWFFIVASTLAATKWLLMLGKLQDGFTVLLMTETKVSIILTLENNTNPFELLGNCRSCLENWMNRGHEKTRLCLEHENKITFYLLFHCS